MERSQEDDVKAKTPEVEGNILEGAADAGGIPASAPAVSMAAGCRPSPAALADPVSWVSPEPPRKAARFTGAQDRGGVPTPATTRGPEKEPERGSASSSSCPLGNPLGSGEFFGAAHDNSLSNPPAEAAALGISPVAGDAADSCAPAGGHVRPGQSRPGPSEPVGDDKRRRVEAGAGDVSPIGRALEWMVARFGEDWRSKFHRTHRLSLAQPLVYCRRCARHCETLQHLVALRRECLEAKGCYPSRLEAIERGRHPLSGAALGRSVPLPLGTKS